MIPKSCRLFGRDRAAKQVIRAKWRFDLIPFRSSRMIFGHRRIAEKAMVVLNRIYTRTGDDGTTALGTGERRKKYDLRVACYGTVDETNAAIGLARLATASGGGPPGNDPHDTDPQPH